MIVSFTRYKRLELGRTLPNSLNGFIGLKFPLHWNTIPSHSISSSRIVQISVAELPSPNFLTISVAHLLRQGIRFDFLPVPTVHCTLHLHQHSTSVIDSNEAFTTIQQNYKKVGRRIYIDQKGFKNVILDKLSFVFKNRVRTRTNL